MPTYEYECRDCGHAFERYQRISDSPLEECPECGGKVRRLISSGGGLVFKGPGFYATDYRSSGAPKTPAPKKKDESSSGKPGGSGSDGDG
jgi:putative FmdB family regulatory protein